MSLAGRLTHNWNPSIPSGRTWGISSGVVLRQGRTVLCAVSSQPVTRSVEVGCDFTEDGWWYSWIEDARTIAPVQDTKCAAEAIIGYLRAEATSRGHGP